jgi:hypothetical protein
MSSVIYGGVKYIRVRHAVHCLLCKDTIESKGYHDFKYCSCGTIGIDDGRVLGDPKDMEPRNIYCANVNGKKLWLPEDAYLNIYSTNKQNAREIEVRESERNSDLTKEATEGGSSS